VNSSLDPRDYTIKTAIPRMEKIGGDPNAQVLTDMPDLSAVLQRLAAVLAT
jgi:hypothetical protein